jgi:hypothetical protein
MRRFAILFFSFFLLFLLSDQNSMAQDFMGWPNFNTVPDTIKNGETKTQARSIKKEEATSPKTNRLAGVEGLAQVSLPDVATGNGT